jgi:hypothetical protein
MVNIDDLLVSPPSYTMPALSAASVGTAVSLAVGTLLGLAAPGGMV